MRGDLLDLVLAVAVVLFALSGYRQGFVVGVLSFVGFLGGGALGARLAPSLAARPFLSGLSPVLTGLVVVFVLATVGQLLATAVGSFLRDKLVWRPARQVDALAGAVVSALSVLLVAWLVGTAVASAPLPALASQVRRSTVLHAVDGLVPADGKRYFTGFRRFVDVRGFPDVFSGLQATSAREVAPPDPVVAGSRAVQVARDEVLKITGTATSCGRQIEGSGFTYAAERVMTNAHVVAGVRSPQVQTRTQGRLPATVVVFDPARDVAVLRVPGLRGTPLDFAPEPAGSGASAVVVGYPLDGPFRAVAARVRDREKARGTDIYDDGVVVREIYALYADVQPGNSGGPLLDGSGRVLGVVFAAAADKASTGYALTAREVAGAAAGGRTGTAPVRTGGCA